jgi:outer membrane protein assembly factor BamB
MSMNPPDDPVADLLGRLERPLSPSASFAATLQRDLLAILANGRAADHEEKTMDTPLVMVLPNHRTPAAPRATARSPRWVSRRLGPALELLAAACLVLTLVSGFLGRDGLLALIPGVQQSNPAPAESGTAMFLGNAARTGEMPGPGPSGNPGVRWRLPLGGSSGVSPASSPIVSNGVAYVTSSGRTNNNTYVTALSAINTATGTVRWSTTVPGLDSGSPAIADGLVVVTTSLFEGMSESGVATPGVEPTDVSDVIAFDAATGDERWRYRSGSAGFLSPAVADGVVYVPSSEDSRLHAIDLLTGQSRWTFQIPSGGPGILSAASPTVTGDTVFIAGNLGVLFAVDAATGHERWQVDIGGNVPTTAAVSNGTLYIGASTIPDEDEAAIRLLDKWESVPVGGPPTGEATPSTRELNGTARLYALDVASGKERWSATLDRVLRPAPAVSHNLVFVAGMGADGTELRALDVATGAERWTSDLGGNLDASPSIAGETVYVGGFDGRVYALDVTTGQERWRVETAGGIASSVFVADGVVLAPSTDGNLYAIGGTVAGAGTPIASPSANGDISGLPPCDVSPRRALTVETPSATPTYSSGPLYEPPVSGTPMASVVPVNEAQQKGQPAAARPEDIPTGKPADAETIAAISATIERMTACDRPGRELQRAAFYSDDYFRRPWVQKVVRLNGFPSLGLGNEAPLLPIRDARLLPDGRVGVLVQYSEEYASFLVYVDQGGRWLIDETVAVSEHPGALG